MPGGNVIFGVVIPPGVVIHPGVVTPGGRVGRLIKSLTNCKKSGREAQSRSVRKIKVNLS
jgi:hypothetical protein